MIGRDGWYMEDGWYEGNEDVPDDDEDDDEEEDDNGCSRCGMPWDECDCDEEDDEELDDFGDPIEYDEDDL